MVLTLTCPHSNYSDVKLDTNERPFPCFCGLAFTRRDLLKRHERISHAAYLAISSEQAPSETQRPRAGQRHQFHRDGDAQQSEPSHNDTLEPSMQDGRSRPMNGWSTLIITSAHSLLSCDNVEA